MTILFDSVPGQFDSAYGLFDDSAVQSGSIEVSGIETTTSVATITSNGVRNGEADVSGITGATSLGTVSAQSDTQPVKSGTSRRRKPGKFVPYVAMPDVIVPEVRNAVAVALSQEASTSVGDVVADGKIIISGRANVVSLQIESKTLNLQGSGIINPTEEEWQILLAA